MSRSTPMRLWPRINQPKPAPVNLDSAQVDQGYKQYKAYSLLLDRNAHWIVVADTRAGVILVFLVAAFPLPAAPALSRVQNVVQVIPHNANFWTYLPIAGFIVLLVLFLVAVLATLLQVLIVLLPRVRRTDESGLVFFGDIASQEYKQWQQRILALSPQMLA